MEGYVVISTVQGQFAEAQLRSFLDAHGIETRVRGVVRIHRVELS